MAAMYQPTTFNPPWVEFFNRPCPHQVKKHNSFPQFSTLPKEIQLMIWEEAIPDRRQICIKSSFGLTFTNKGKNVMEGDLDGILQYKTACFSNAKTPAILHATHDSRKIALKTFKQAFKAQFGAPIYVNFELDLFRSQDRDAFELFFQAERKSTQSQSLMDSIKYLFLDCKMEPYECDIIYACSKFAGLKHILFGRPVRSRNWRIKNASNVSKVYLPKDTMEDWKRLVPRILRNKEFWSNYSLSVEEFGKQSKSELTSWMPPVVTSGNITQWKNTLSASGGTLGWVLGQEKSWGTLHLEDKMEYELNISFPSLGYSLP